VPASTGGAAATAGASRGSAAAEPIAALPAAEGAFPRVLTAAEITAHFARYSTIEARQGPQQFTLYLRPGNRVERLCPGCRIPNAAGNIEIDSDRGAVCFRWRATWYPDSGCYRIIQTAADRYMMRGVDQQRPIEYSAVP
jgi:hypothetical protein